MRDYRDRKFTGEVAAFVQDRLNETMFGLSPIESELGSKSNLCRARIGCSRRAHHLHTAMHDVDTAYLQICAVKLPDNASRDLERRLDQMMNDLADLSEELSQLWDQEAKSIWMKIPYDDRVERLQDKLAELQYWKNDEEVRVRLVDLLQFWTLIDPTAAEAAGVEADKEAKAAIDNWPLRDPSFRDTAETFSHAE